MNDFEIEMGKILFEYQRKHGGKGEAHPKEIIEALGNIRDRMISDYGLCGEKVKFCDICGYYCECDK